MKNLTKYVEGVNVMRRIFGDEEFNVNELDQGLANKLFHKLDGELSPENLHCDGEITAAQARKKARLFHGAIEDLTRLGFTIPEDCYF